MSKLEKIVGTLSAGMSSMKKGIQSGMDSCKLEGKISEQHHLIKKRNWKSCDAAFRCRR